MVAEALRADELAALEGLIAPATGLRLAELAATVAPEHVILEIGSYKGKSACYLAEGARCGRGATVHCVDPWDSKGNISGKHGFTDPSIRETFTEQTASMGLSVQAHHMFSYELARSWRHPIGMLFIDGSHEYAAVKGDFYGFLRWTVAGGTVAFDDYGTRNRGVTKFVNEMRSVYLKWDFETPPLAIMWRHE